MSIEHDLDDIKFLRSLGWPEWPPAVAPELFPWWKTKISVLPTRMHTPDTYIFTCDGSPEAGKSTILDSINKQGLPLKRGWKFEVHDELGWLNPETKHLSFDFPYPVEDEHVFLADTRNLSLSKLWEASLAQQEVRDSWWRQILLDYKIFLHPDTVALGFRGPLDVSIFLNTIATCQSDDRFLVPTVDKVDFIRKASSLLASSQRQVTNIDALILVGIGKEGAERRNPHGISLSPFFNELNSWYGYFIRNVWKNLYSRYGTGLLVLDGDNTVEKNSETVRSYILESIHSAREGSRLKPSKLH